jgi:ComF family protein
MYKIFKDIHHHLSDLIAPPFCVYCKVYVHNREILCSHCAGHVMPIASVTMPLAHGYEMKVFAISAYQDPIKKLILAKGWSDICASKKLGELAWEMTSMRYMPIDYLVPIPLHWTRFAKRGFNQTEEMAHAIATQSKLRVAHLLKRVKRTQFQSELPAAERGKNVHDAFVLATKDTLLYHGKHLMLVDDLMTTGSTLHAAAKELIKIKPASISAVVACRVI